MLMHWTYDYGFLCVFELCIFISTFVPQFGDFGLVWMENRVKGDKLLYHNS